MLAAYCLVEVLQDVTHSIKAEACFPQSQFRFRVGGIKLGRLASSPVCRRKVKV